MKKSGRFILNRRGVGFLYGNHIYNVGHSLKENIMKSTKLLFVFAIGVLIPYMASAKSLNNQFLYSTVFIKNQSTRKSGTGFLVRRKVSKERIVVYLLSNKHVLLPSPIDPDQKNHLAKAEIEINKSVSNKIEKAILSITLRDSKGQTFVKGHPNKDVDVAAISVAKDIEGSLGTAFAIPEERFATKEFIDKNFVSVGDRALIIGYPLNLVEQGHVTPIARSAIIATHPNKAFQNLPLFLIDGTVLRGSSGSPVILPIRPYVWIEEKRVNIAKVQQNHLLGIVKGHIKDWQMIIRKTVTPKVVQEFSIIDNSQLGLVFPAYTILEVMNLFPHKKWNGRKTE